MSGATAAERAAAQGCSSAQVRGQQVEVCARRAQRLVAVGPALRVADLRKFGRIHVRPLHDPGVDRRDEGGGSHVPARDDGRHRPAHRVAERFAQHIERTPHHPVGRRLPVGFSRVFKGRVSEHVHLDPLAPVRIRWWY
eukprot:976806-Prymnesium_polylepis.1